MCFFGGGGGAPQVIYRDNPATQIPPPLPAPSPTAMNDSMTPAMDVQPSSGDVTSAPDYKGTSVFKINRNYVNPMATEDMGIDSGLQYLG